MLPAQKAARMADRLDSSARLYRIMWAAEECLELLLEALEGSLADVYGSDHRGSRSCLCRIFGRAGLDVAPKSGTLAESLRWTNVAN